MSPREGTQGFGRRGRPVRRWAAGRGAEGAVPVLKPEPRRPPPRGLYLLRAEGMRPVVQNEPHLGARLALRQQRRAASLLLRHPSHFGVRARGGPRLPARCCCSRPRCPAERRRLLPPGRASSGDEQAPGKCSFSGDKAAEARGVCAQQPLECVSHLRGATAR